MKHKAFSLAEMMVVLLITCIVMAASVPIITKKAAQPTTTTSSGGVPIGTIITWASSTDPSGNGVWLECNGGTIPTKYDKLIKLVGPNTPNYQGMFLRGVGSQNYTDGFGTVTHSSYPLGTIQGDTIRTLTGSGSFKVSLRGNAQYSGAFTGKNEYGADWSSGSACNHMVTYTMNLANNVPTDNEVRPVNISVRYFIKAN